MQPVDDELQEWEATLADGLEHDVPSDPALLGVVSPQAIPPLIPARATITIYGMRAGDKVQADPLSEVVQECFEHGWLVRR